MKKIITCYFVLLVLISKATHNRAGEILYKRIAPFTEVTNGVTIAAYTYSITVIKYTDDGVGVANRCVDTVYFGDGDRAVAPRINGATSCGCGSLNGQSIGCGSLIVNQPSYRVKYNVYSIIHTYAGPGSYLIWTSDPNRNQGVHNIPNSVNVPFYLGSLLVINLSGANSSVVLTNPPTDQALLGNCFYHNVGAVDTDGDSLSYEISTCKWANGQTIPGYFHPETGTNGMFIIDQTGKLSWCTPQFAGEYNIAILVKEWRKNTSGVYQLIGYVLRDMQVLAKVGIIGINENKFAESIHVYPNPFSENLEINFGSANYNRVETSIYANDGKLVFESVNNVSAGNPSLPLSVLLPGIYLLQLKTEGGTVYKKIIRN